MKKLLLSICCLIVTSVVEAQIGGRIYDECNDLSAVTWHGGNQVVSGSQSDWTARQGDVYRYALSGSGYSYLVYQIPDGLNVKSITVDFYSPGGMKPTLAVKNSSGQETKFVQSWSNGYPIETSLGANISRHYLAGVASFNDAKEAVIYLDGGSDIEIMRIIIEYGDGYTIPNYNEGSDFNRVKRLLAKASSGKDITIGVIGGSITAGANAEPIEANCYGERLKVWFENTYGINVTLINAGIGSTNSYYGTIRAEDQLLRYNPDLIVVEYAVNDDVSNEIYKLSYEGLLRKVMKAPGYPAVIPLMLCTQAKISSQSVKVPFAQYYQLPIVSYADAVADEIANASKTWLNYYGTSVLASGDGVHPNTAGHQKITDLLSNLFLAVTPDAAAPLTYDLPLPLYSAALEDGFMLSENNITPQKTGVWFDGDNNKWLRINPGGKGWMANTVGSELAFDFIGDAVAVTYWRRPTNENHGQAEIWVDNNSKTTVNSQGDNLDQLILSGLGSGAHKLHIRLIENKNFEISNIVIAGDRDYFNSSKNIKSALNQKQISIGNGNSIGLESIGSQFDITRTADGFLIFKNGSHYLSVNSFGTLVLSSNIDDASKFLFVDKGSAFALRSVENGKYLSVQGELLQAIANTVTTSELFTLIDDSTVSIETDQSGSKETFEMKGNSLNIYNADGKAVLLSDISGRIIFAKQMLNSSFTTTLNSGVYLLQIGSEVSKIIADN